MSDLADHAGELEEQQRTHALLAQSAVAVEMPRHDRDGNRICLACEERLSKKRISASPHAVRCVDCQGLYEKRKRGYRV